MSLVSSVFDPLGVLTPSLLESKLIIQELWKLKIDWDSKILLEIETRWIKWKICLDKISQVSLNRWYGFQHIGKMEVELNSFCDASAQAYRAVAYFVFSVNHIRKNCSFVLSKSLLLPLKNKGLITIQRLELQAAVLVVRLKNKILDEIDIKIDSIRFLTDSQITLCSIKNLSRKFSVYIMNRLNEIRVNSNVEEWFFVPGELNPADHCTRYLPFSVLSLKSNWIAGPRFLCASSVIILKTESTQVEAEDVEKHTHLLINRENNSDISVLKWEHYSSYFKLLRHVAYILKMKRHWINVKRKRPEKINFKEQTVVEIKAAEHQIIAQAQIECYHEEQNSLRNNKPLQKTSTLLSLRPILTDNLLRVGGKVAHSFLPFDSKHQIILAKKLHLSELLIKDIHVRNCHSGR